jgi:hypothetical protein
MKGILTPEEKKYLRKVTNYLGSLGMRDGNIELDVESGESFDPNDIDWNEITYFSNNFRAEIPSGLIPILQKIMGHAEELNLIQEIDEDEINYQRIEFDIDTETKDIVLSHWWSFYAKGDGSSIEYDDDEGKGIFEEWEKDGVFNDTKIPEDGILTATYNGSGDSGFLEDFFNENNESVPGAIEDWCYTQLSNNFGGWEDNEGADGEFIFDFNNKTITLYHTENIEDTEANTIFEENFRE